MRVCPSVDWMDGWMDDYQLFFRPTRIMKSDSEYNRIVSPLDNNCLNNGKQHFRDMNCIQSVSVGIPLPNGNVGLPVSVGIPLPDGNVGLPVGIPLPDGNVGLPVSVGIPLPDGNVGLPLS